MAKNNDEVRITLRAVLSPLTEGLKTATKEMKRFAKDTKDIFAQITGRGPGGIGRLIAKVLKAVSVLALLPLRIAAAFIQVIPYIGNLGKVLGFFADAAEQVLGIVSDVVGIGVDFIVAGIETVLGIVQGVISGVISAIRGILDVITGVVRGIVDIVSSVAEKVLGIVGGLVSKLSPLFSVGGLGFAGAAGYAVKREGE